MPWESAVKHLKQSEWYQPFLKLLNFVEPAAALEAGASSKGDKRL
jgi:hypothetical protein